VSDFVLHTRLEADTLFVADWPLSRVLLMNDARYPWLILVPRRADATEVHDLSVEDRTALIEEAARASKGMKKLATCAKINIGALGNLVPQLHIHIVARNPDDAAWPAPVWGVGKSVPYAQDAAERLLVQLRSNL
jgi:diadenosine tetraphosphate (Ap4A) HIT family hydrolase